MGRAFSRSKFFIYLDCKEFINSDPWTCHRTQIEQTCGLVSPRVMYTMKHSNQIENQEYNGSIQAYHMSQALFSDIAGYSGFIRLTPRPRTHAYK